MLTVGNLIHALTHTCTGISVGYIPRSRLAESKGMGIYNVVSYYYIVRNRGFINFHSCKQWVRIPYFLKPLPTKYIVKSFELFPSKWRRIEVILMSISLTVSETEHPFSCLRSWWALQWGHWRRSSRQTEPRRRGRSAVFPRESQRAPFSMNVLGRCKQAH